MSVKSEINAAYVLVDYAFAVLNKNMPNVWNKSKYGGMVPIVPLSEEPELNASSGPHIVYGYTEDATGNHYAIKGGSISFAVYDHNFRRLTQTMNVLKTAFERQDESARDVNNFSTGHLNGYYLNVMFGSLGIGFIEGGTPEDSEEGRQSALISITYSYYLEYDIDTSV